MVQMRQRTPTDFTTEVGATHFSSQAVQERPSQGGGTDGQLSARSRATWLLLGGSLDPRAEAGG